MKKVVFLLLFTLPQLYFAQVGDIQPKTYWALNGTIELNENKLKDEIVPMKFDLNFEGEEGSHFENLSAPST